MLPLGPSLRRGAEPCLPRGLAAMPRGLGLGLGASSIASSHRSVSGAGCFPPLCKYLYRELINKR